MHKASSILQYAHPIDLVPVIVSISWFCTVCLHFAVVSAFELLVVLLIALMIALDLRSVTSHDSFILLYFSFNTTRTSIGLSGLLPFA